MAQPLRVVVAGLGNMGRSHALAYHTNPGFEIAALINRSDVPLPEGLSGYGIKRSFDDALRDETRHYAKRQFTWFRHQLPEFEWVTPEAAREWLATVIPGRS